MALDCMGEAKCFLTSCLKGKVSLSKHPWRKSWEFVYQHSLRVEAIALKLLSAEAPGWPAEDVLALRLAAILHDCGRLDEREIHGLVGSQIASRWLDENPEIAAQVGCPEWVAELIAGHSNKDEPAPDLGHAILRDADLLDEIGIFSIFMASSWVESNTPFFFYDLVDRLQQFEIPFCQKTLVRLKTQAGKAYLEQKTEFIQAVIRQFHLELEGVEREGWPVS
jgi:uncharacterized protein